MTKSHCRASRSPILQTGLLAVSLFAIGCSDQGGTIVTTNGGTARTGGTAATGGSTAGGGTTTGGTATTGGSTATGGSAATGGTRSGGTVATGGTAPDAGVDGPMTNPDTARTGGTSTGGTATGRTPVTGGVTSTGGSADGCDIGVYAAATPPKVLSLTGSLGVHDPVLIQSGSTYYLFTTGLGAKTSTNLTTWAAASRPFTAPSWMTAAVPGVTDLWAPDISFFGGKYHLYYSGSTFGSNKSCIGHATRDSMSSGSWTDQGSAAICSNVGTSDNWNAIDPNVVLDTAGTPWLSFGSFWSGLKIVQLDSAGLRVGSTVTAIAARPNNGGAMEAPFIVRRCSYYYLFMSWDKCCAGADSTYNIRVARGTNVTGPYTDKAGTAAMQGGGTLVTQGDATWAGPGHQAVLFVGTKAYLVYHAYAKSNGAATLRIAELVWDTGGWPMPIGP